MLKSIKDKIIKLLASVFYCGYVPVGSGTIGSLPAIMFYMLFLHNVNAIYYSVLMVLLVIAGIIISDEAEQVFGKKDDGRIVVDEFCGMLIALFMIPPKAIYLVWAFILFRILDITKPYPIRASEKVKGGLGVMLDDVLSGVFTNAILQLIIRGTQYLIIF